MIAYYRYCGISKDGKRIWGAVNWIDNTGYLGGIYIFWGSKNKPMIRQYHINSYSPKSNRIDYRIINKRAKYSDYIEIEDKDIPIKLPGLESHINEFMLFRKLKFNV